MLAWLYSRASKVYQWFGSSYPVWVSRVRNFFSYLRKYRDQAVRWVKDWALPKILSYYYQARNYVLIKYNAAISWINHQYHIVRNFITIEIIKVKNLLGIKIEKLGAEDQRLADQIVRGDNVVKTFLKNWVKGFIDHFLHPFKWVIELKEFLEDLFKLFTSDNKNRLIFLLGSGFTFLLDLITRPLSIILAIIQPIFLEFLCFILAYALGSEKYQLPDWPDWFSGSGGGPISGFDPPGDAKRDLGKPLNNLYISGYRFRIGHRGLDLGLKNGDPVYAMHSGRVEYVNQVFSGYGFQVILSGGPWWTRSAHLQKLGVRKGDQVSKGKVIGLGDDTGASTGPHLHLEIKYNGKFVDPEMILF